VSERRAPRPLLAPAALAAALRELPGWELRDGKLQRALAFADFAGSLSGLRSLFAEYTADYGGKLGGVLSMRSVEAPADRLRTEVGLSVTSMRVLSRGSFLGGRGGWLASARRGYLDLALRLAGAADSTNSASRVSPDQSAAKVEEACHAFGLNRFPRLRLATQA
jgi:hypothetical protein